MKIIALHSKRVRLVSSSVNAREPRPPLIHWLITQAFNCERLLSSLPTLGGSGRDPEREELTQSEYGSMYSILT
jgi:hypothetical protein